MPPQNRSPRSTSSHALSTRAASVLLWLLLLVTAFAAVCWSAAWASRWSGRAVEVPGSMVWPAAQALAFPLGSGAVLVVLFLLLGWWRGRRGPRRPLLPLLGVLLAVLGTVAALVPAEQPAQQARDQAADGHRSARIISWNSKDTVTKADVQTMLGQQPQAVVLPESNPGMIQWFLVQLGRDQDVQLFHSQEAPDVAPTTVLVSSSLGKYHEVPGPATTLGTVTVEPEDASSPSPRIVGVHTASPRMKWMGAWHDEVQAITRDVCGRNTERPVLAAGDFNATTAHGTLPGLAADEQCTDALPSVGDSTGTWPVAAPSALRAQIVHVLAGPGASVESAGLETGLPETSDHEPIRATVRY